MQEQEQQTPSPADASTEAPETVTDGLQAEETRPEAESKPAPVAEADDTASDDPPAEKPKRSARERINELTKRAHEAEREVQRLRESADRPAPEATEKPSPDKFTSYDDYVEALADWKADRRIAESFRARDADLAKAAESRAVEAKAQAWAERQESFRESTPDYDAVVGKSSVQVAPHVVDTLLGSDSGPELAYHLAKNPDTVKRINALSPLAAARELGRIEAGLSTPAAPRIKPASNAPTPITRTRSAAVVTADPASMTMEQYSAMRAKQGARWAR